MRGIGAEPAEVWLRDGRPARFIWRGRMHTVLLVLDRRSAAGDETAAGRAEVWLVEATAQRSVPPTRYELRHDPASDRWTLSR